MVNGWVSLYYNPVYVQLSSNGLIPKELEASSFGPKRLVIQRALTSKRRADAAQNVGSPGAETNGVSHGPR